MMDLLDEAFAVMLRNLDGDAGETLPGRCRGGGTRINRRRDKLRRAHLKSVETGSYNVKSGLIYSDLFSSCEKVGDHRSTCRKRSPARSSPAPARPTTTLLSCNARSTSFTL